MHRMLEALFGGRGAILRWLAYHEGQTVSVEQLKRETNTGNVYLTVLRNLARFGLVAKYPMHEGVGAQWRWVVEEHQLWSLVRDLDKESDALLD